MHRKPERLRQRLVAAAFVALVVLAGAALLSRPTYVSAADGVPAVAGTYICVVQANGDGFNQQCTPVTPTPNPSGTPSASPSASATPTPTVSPTPSPTLTTVTPTVTPTPSAVPTPTPTPSSAPTACLPKPSACGFPDATDTGIPAGTALTASSGDFTVRTAGAVIDGMDISGCVTIAASNVVIRNSRIRCAGPYGVHNDVRNSVSNVVVQNVEIDCLNNAGTTGIAGHNIATSGANIHGCENGLDMGDNTSVQGSYIHGLFLGSGGHTDAIQSGGKGVNIVHNTLINDTAGGTSTIITDPTTTANFVISGNLLSNDGGSYVLYCPKSGSGFTVTGNRLAWAHDFGYDYNGQCGASWVTWSGNVADATGTVLGP